MNRSGEKIEEKRMEVRKGEEIKEAKGGGAPGRALASSAVLSFFSPIPHSNKKLCMRSTLTDCSKTLGSTAVCAISPKPWLDPNFLQFSVGVDRVYGKILPTCVGVKTCRLRLPCEGLSRAGLGFRVETKRSQKLIKYC